MWPVPFADGLHVLKGLRGRAAVMLVSGNPFWFGAGTVIARELDPAEWRAYPGPSTGALAAARLGWPLERIPTLGLHTAPVETLVPHLANGQRLLLLMRDGTSPHSLANWLTRQGWGNSVMHVLEALGGPNERIRRSRADTFALDSIRHPVCVALETEGGGKSPMPLVPGRADEWFEHDGQITKSPIRALTLAALAPHPGAHLWDIGAGSGAVGIEWLLAHSSTSATAVERNRERADRARSNASRLGVLRLDMRVGSALDMISSLPRPDAVFVGGGLDATLLERLWKTMPHRSRLVVNAVTLETEAILTLAHADKGGSLSRFSFSHAAALGGKRGWQASRAIVQWSVTR